MARDDTSGGVLSLVDAAAFTKQLKEMVALKLQGYDEHQSDMAEVREAMREASPTKPPMGGGGERGRGSEGERGRGHEGGVVGGALGRALGVPDLPPSRVQEIRASFRAQFGGKCLYMALTGACNPKAGSECTFDHTDMPVKADMEKWAKACNCTLQP